VYDGLDIFQTETSLSASPRAVSLDPAQTLGPLTRLQSVHHHPQSLAAVAVAVALDHAI
jgi:hypothetical protein